MVCSLHIYEDLIPRQTCILTDSWFWPKCCGSDSWDSLPYVVNSQRTTLYQCLTKEYLLACARNFHRTACWRRLGIVLQKLTPLKTLLGKDSVPYAGSFCGCLLKKAEYLVRKSSMYRTEEDRWILPWKLLWYLAREDWVAYTRSFLLWYADRFPHI